MTSRIVYPTCLGVCLAVLALSAGGADDYKQCIACGRRRSSGSNAGVTKTTAASTAPKTASNSAHQHHATAHHKTHATHKQAESASPGSYQEAAYRDALHQCVAGPVGQREGCLDNAIMRFGRT